MLIETDLLMTPAKYANIIGKTRQTVYNRINSGKIDSICIDGILFVKLSVKASKLKR